MWEVGWNITVDFVQLEKASRFNIDEVGNSAPSRADFLGVATNRSQHKTNTLPVPLAFNHQPY
jgi:hypothetical protein